MTVTSKDMKNGKAVEPQIEPVPFSLIFNRIISVLFWSIGCFFTWLVFDQFPLPPMMAYVIAVGFQAGLTLIESPVWNEEKRYQYDEQGYVITYEAFKYKFFGPLIEKPDLRPITLLEWGALAIDDIFNMGGIWVFVKMLHELDIVHNFAEMFGYASVAPIRGWTALGLCAILGAFFCGAPERLWHKR